MKGEYANAFSKFRPKKVEVNEATVEEAIKYGHFLKRSEEDIAEAWNRLLLLTPCDIMNKLLL